MKSIYRKIQTLSLKILTLGLLFSCSANNTSTEAIHDDQIHVCTELLPKKIEFPSGPQKSSESQKLAIQTAFKWRTGSSPIKVTFLDGGSKLINRVMESAKTWEKVCGISFEFGTFDHPDISISFNEQGSWSWVGKESRKHSPSMNFGWLYETIEQEELDRVVLHEFGHALGFVHEHLSPEADIQWNKQRVYEYYQGSPNFWSISDIDFNIFNKYDRSQTNYTAFDPESIMIYAIPSEFTTNGFSVSENSKLSEMDIEFAQKMYPKN